MDVNVLQQQIEILFEACKKVATAQNCPKWIADLLREEVMKAKQVQAEFPTLSTGQEVYQEVKPFEVGEIVVINNNGVSCVAKLVKEAIPVDEVRLFDVQVVQGNKNHNPGQIFYNIPETKMTRK